jgi:hypothetical protein
VSNVVQVVIYSATHCVVGGVMLEVKHAIIFWMPCVAHYLDLMLEDMGKIEWMKKVVGKTKSIIEYIYNHLKSLDKHNQGPTMEAISML